MKNQHKKIEIVSIGNELVFGELTNTNAPYLAEQLSARGGLVHRITTVGDRKRDIFKTLRRALSENDIVLVTGGLGPTDDDITRETVSEFLSAPLVRNVVALKNIQRWFKRAGLSMPEHNAKQAMVLKGCKVIQNDWGTAPAMILDRMVDWQGRILILLTGYPSELRLLMENKVLFYLEKHLSGVVKHLNIQTRHTEESRIEELLRPVTSHMSSDMVLAYLPEDDGVKLRLTCWGRDAREVSRKLDMVKKELLIAIEPYLKS